MADTGHPRRVTVFIGGVYEYEDDGSSVTQTSYCRLSGRLVAVRRCSWLDCLGQDHLASTAITHSATTGTTGTCGYVPFGEPRGSSTPAGITDRAYTGQVAAASTDLMFYNARYYDPILGPVR